MNNANSGKQISVLWAITLTVGAMVGSAIFSLSGVTIAFAGSYSILSWGLAALINLLFAMVVAQLARKWPEEDGGIYIYPKRIIATLFAQKGARSDVGSSADQSAGSGADQSGAQSINSSTAEKAGSIVGYVGMVVYSVGCFAGVVFSCSYFAQYLVYILPMQGDTGVMITMAAVLVLLICGWLNLSGLKTSARINGVLVIFLVALMLFLAIYFSVAGGFSFETIAQRTPPDMLSGISTSLPVAILAYGAIVTPAFLSSSIKNPRKNVPVIMLVSMLVVAALYILQMVILNGVLPANYGSDPAELYTPYFSALAALGEGGASGAISLLVTLGSLLALFTTALVLMRLLAVSVQRASLEGSLPQCAQRPSAVYGGVCVVGAVILLLGESAVNLVQLGAILNVIYFSVICLCALLFKELKAYWRALALVVLLVLGLCSVGSVQDGGALQLAFSGGIILLALVGYFVYQKFSVKSGAKPNEVPRKSEGEIVHE